MIGGSSRRLWSAGKSVWLFTKIADGIIELALAGGFHFEELAFASVKEPQKPPLQLYKLKPHGLSVTTQPTPCDAQLS